MTAKEKAMELVDLFYQLFPLDKDVITTDGELHWEYNDWQQSKKAALIAVDEIIEAVGNNSESHIWIKVKQEIEKL